MAKKRKRTGPSQTKRISFAFVVCRFAFSALIVHNAILKVSVARSAPTRRRKARLVHGQPFPLALYTIPSSSQRIIYACDAL